MKKLLSLDHCSSLIYYGNVLKKEYQKLFSDIIHTVKGFYKNDLVSCAIFGSVARDTATPESDIDILIVADNLPKGRIKRVIQFEAVEESLLKAHANLLFSPLIKTPREVKMGSPLFWDMTEDVVILFDRNDFLKEYLKSVAQNLRKNKARKVMKGSAWYWILKGDYVPGEVFKI